MKFHKTYSLGFILAFLLTCLSFILAATEAIPVPWAMAGIVLSAVAQIVVHLHNFLHLNRSPAVRWNVYVLLFTFMLIAFFVAGTIWVMSTLDKRMM